MITNSTLIMSNWLRGSVYGINKLLPDIPREKPTGGNFDAPRPVTIYDDVQDPSVAMELDPDKVPAVVLFCDADAEIEEAGSGQKGYGIVLVAAYIDRDSPHLLMRQEGGLVARAVRRSLNKFNVPSLSRKVGTLNRIQVVKVTAIKEVRVAAAIGNSTLAGFVRATLTVLDLAP